MAINSLPPVWNELNGLLTSSASYKEKQEGLNRYSPDVLNQILITNNEISSYVLAQIRTNLQNREIGRNTQSLATRNVALGQLTCSVNQTLNHSTQILENLNKVEEATVKLAADQEQTQIEIAVLQDLSRQVNIGNATNQQDLTLVQEQAAQAAIELGKLEDATAATGRQIDPPSSPVAAGVSIGSVIKSTIIHPWNWGRQKWQQFKCLSQGTFCTVATSLTTGSVGATVGAVVIKTTVAAVTLGISGFLGGALLSASCWYGYSRCVK